MAKKKQSSIPRDAVSKARKAAYERARRGKKAAFKRELKYSKESGGRVWVVHENAGKIDYWASELSQDWPPSTDLVVGQCITHQFGSMLNLSSSSRASSSKCPILTQDECQQDQTLISLCKATHKIRILKKHK